MHPNEMFEHPPLFLMPAPDPKSAPAADSTAHPRVPDCAAGSLFFRLLKTSATRIPVHQAPHGDSAHDFLVR
ncbi:MAG: hypothetical protein KA257_00930 [Opitutaceae bacterium]|nr:hypothetical protein [Opitutaceae bacterium]MBP9912150.1 hypothetical protein [Opitutaceae bacterium]